MLIALIFKMFCIHAPVVLTHVLANAQCFDTEMLCIHMGLLFDAGFEGG
jgi:hypothetical protein